MNCQKLLLNELEHYRANQLFMASQVYTQKFAKLVKEAAFYKALERLVKKNILCRYAKGVYCKLKIGRFGIVPPSAEEIATTMIQDGKGMYLGYKLYNHLGLTTQISKNIDILTTEQYTQTHIGNITLSFTTIKLTTQTEKMIAVLEVIKNIDDVQDLNQIALQKYLKEFALHAYNDSCFHDVYRVCKYPKYVLNQLKNILDYYHVPNQIASYLSTLSKYKKVQVMCYEATSIPR